MVRPYAILTLLFAVPRAMAAEPLGLPKLVELVHGDAEVSSLDKQETEILSDVLDGAAEPDTVRSGQEKWVARMANCPDKDCVVREYRQRLTDLPRYPLASWKTYRDEALGISFQYLGNRSVGACPDSMAKPCVAVFADGLNGNNFEIAFQVFERPLKDTADSMEGFAKDGGEWTITGAKQPVQGPNWVGLKASFACGRDDGDHAAIFTNCFRAVLGHGARSVVAGTWGAINPRAQRSLRTFRFLR